MSGRFTPFQNSKFVPVILVLFIQLAVLSSADYYWSIPFKCFDRIGIGRRLNETEVNRTVVAKSSRECELECDKDNCQTFAFGVGASGNGTCDIAIGMPTTLPIENKEYDLFTRNFKCKNKTTSCFRRFAPGRRLMDKYIRKTLACDSLRHCEEDCAQEYYFYCEGFSFRYSPKGSICQLAASPADKLDILKDFNSDRAWDYYERDRNAPKSCYRPQAGFRPWTQYGGPQQHNWQQQYPQPQPPPQNYPQPPPLQQQQYPQRPPPDYPLRQPSYHPNALPPSAPPAFSSSSAPHQLQQWAPGPSAASAAADYGQPQGGGGGPPPPDYGSSGGGGGGYYGGFKDPYPHQYYPSGDGHQQNSLQPIAAPPLQHYQHHPGSASGNECFLRTKVGFRLDRSVVVLSLTSPSLYNCELECANEKKFLCKIFSYKYTKSQNALGDNCHLGERPFHTLDIYTDLVPDKDYDIYTRNEKAPPLCVPRHSSDSDCFERVRSGLRLDSTMTKNAMMANSISDCEQACINSNTFTCRAFSYRYGPPTIGQDRENCQMTDFPVPELNPLKHFVDDPSCELYHRGSYGHGCEVDKWAHHHPPHHHKHHHHHFHHHWKPPPPPPKHNYLPPHPHPRPEPYPPTYRPTPVPASGTFASGAGFSSSGFGPTSPPPHYPPSSNSILSTYGPPVHHKPYPSFIPPTAPSYAPPTNTYLPPVNFDHPSASRDKMCYLGYATPARLMPSAIRSSLMVPNELECKAQCSRARDTSRFRCASLSYRGNNCELSDIEHRDLRPGMDFAPDESYWLYAWDFTDARCYIPPRGNVLAPSGPDYMGGGMASTWQRFTVSGHPCRAGTVCSQNMDIGVWTCPVENGLEGDWDYCCRSGHQCGYSEGFSYPWCYVGSSAKDQWRPCSEHYYPYKHSNRPLHWPVAYLHKESPPNMTNNFGASSVPTATGTVHIPHQPSIVDNFLETLKQESLKANTSATTVVPKFEVVDVKPDPKEVSSMDSKTEESALSKLWMWGQSKLNRTDNSAETTDSASPATEMSTITTPNDEIGTTNS
ncbi:hypothetical protein LSTR_LSTR005317 [Laodelphax striatellus]|uniref:Apple domain-containing protein n=1 Tax=Laodelphax striatellus TaxID=195883 RepID=A0A482X7F6_LAOST|nr:hypothetical protein LSTR_LSTR005317 [Laodelphax striatellus]